MLCGAERIVSQGTTKASGETFAGGAKRKRKRDEGRNEFLPDRPRDELDEQAVGSLVFNEVLDEEVRVRLSRSSCVPVCVACFGRAIESLREVLLLLSVLIPRLLLPLVCPAQG